MNSSEAAGGRLGGWGNPWLHLALSTVCVTVSELFLKMGAAASGHASDAWAWTGIAGLLSPLVWLGIVFVIASFLTWLYVLKHLPLSLAFPASQAVHVLVPLSSWLILGELISPLRWCGIGLVLVGLAVVARPVAQLEERL
ncbi:MAG: EamA family transporter [Verrucomicrobiota bacterium]|nr:EamA family transporter [Verrucomicrobiota bacterium]